MTIGQYIALYAVGVAVFAICLGWSSETEDGVEDFHDALLAVFWPFSLVLMALFLLLDLGRKLHDRLQ